MESNQKTIVCSSCGRELPLSDFHKGRKICKECVNKRAREWYRKRKNSTYETNPALADFTPQELLTELRARGYRGSITYTETKVHKITL